MRENEREAGKVRWVRPDGLDDVGGPVGRRGRRWARTLTVQVVAKAGDSDGDNMDIDQHANVEWEQEHAAIKKKLEISWVHWRSSMGR